MKKMRFQIWTIEDFVIPLLLSPIKYIQNNFTQQHIYSLPNQDWLSSTVKSVPCEVISMELLWVWFHAVSCGWNNTRNEEVMVQIILMYSLDSEKEIKNDMALRRILNTCSKWNSGPGTDERAFIHNLHWGYNWCRRR